LRRFADDLDDPSADLVIGALILNARLRGPGLRDMLGALAASAREEIDMRRRVEANRRTTRRSVQIVVGISVFTMLALVVFRREYVAEYDTLLGQLVLGVVVGLFAAGFVWLRRLANFEMPGRFLSATSATAGTPATSGAAATSSPSRVSVASAAAPSTAPSAPTAPTAPSTPSTPSTAAGSTAGSSTISSPGTGSATESWPGSRSATESWPGSASATESWPGTGSATRSWPSGPPPVPDGESGSGRTRPAQGGER
jgi:hypothetical protein